MVKNISHPSAFRGNDNDERKYYNISTSYPFILLIFKFVLVPTPSHIFSSYFLFRFQIQHPLALCPGAYFAKQSTIIAVYLCECLWNVKMLRRSKVTKLKILKLKIFYPSQQHFRFKITFQFMKMLKMPKNNNNNKSIFSSSLISNRCEQQLEWNRQEGKYGRESRKLETRKMYTYI